MPGRRLRSITRRFLQSQRQEARRVVTELVQMRGLMPLLMKPRNGQQWTPAERAQLMHQLRVLSRLSPYLLFLILPGSAVLLPLYAWWLDRRRQQRSGSKSVTV